MTKTEAYQQLIIQFKDITDLGESLINPYEIIRRNPTNEKITSFNQINPVSIWQHNLDAEILVIGQDWGPETEFKKNGRDRNDNLFVKRTIDLFAQIGFNIGTPESPISQPLFFTNLILGIRVGDKYSGPTKQEWISKSWEWNTKLIDIIKPKIILCLGEHVSRSVFKEYKIKFTSLKEAVEKAPIQVDGKLIFTVYHPSTRGVNKTIDQQSKDWNKIKSYL